MYSKAYGMLGGNPDKMSTQTQTIKIIEQGLPLVMLQKAAETFSIPENEIATMIGLSYVDLQQIQTSQNTRFSSLQSEHLLKVITLLMKVNEYFNAKQPALNWLNRPNLSLTNQKPIELLTTSIGIDLVSDKINALANGMMA